MPFATAVIAVFLMNISAAVRAALTQKDDSVFHAAGSPAVGFQDAARSQFLQSFGNTASASSAAGRPSVFQDAARSQFLQSLKKKASASSEADPGEGRGKVAFSFSGLRRAVGGA